MFKLPYGFTVVAAAGLVAASAAGVRAQESPETPADVMVTFLKAFEVHDYDTCRSLLLPDATITITRRMRGGSYESQHLSAWDWLDQVGGTGVHDIEGFTVNILGQRGATEDTTSSCKRCPSDCYIADTGPSS